MLAFWPALEVASPLPRFPRSHGPSCPLPQPLATPGEWRSKINTDEVFRTRRGSPIGSPPVTRVNGPVIDAIENGSIDLALRYGISGGYAPRLERLGRTRAAVCCRLQPVSAESDDRHGRA